MFKNRIFTGRSNDGISNLSENELKEYVLIARTAVEKYVREGEVIDGSDFGINKLDPNCGLFVTLYGRFNNKNELRGCIGHIVPNSEVPTSIIDIAIKAATQDPRFYPVKEHELRNIVFEVSFLSEPRIINTKEKYEYFNKIKIGRDGLILESNYGLGVLLPQVAVEHKWNVEQYLVNLCAKTGAPSNSWLLPSSKIFRFETFIFSEKEPYGEIIKIKI